MLQLAGAHADGRIINSLNTTKYFNDIVYPNIRIGLDKAGPKRSMIPIPRSLKVN